MLLSSVVWAGRCHSQRISPWGSCSYIYYNTSRYTANKRKWTKSVELLFIVVKIPIYNYLKKIKNENTVHLLKFAIYYCIGYGYVLNRWWLTQSLKFLIGWLSRKFYCINLECTYNKWNLWENQKNIIFLS